MSCDVLRNHLIKSSWESRHVVFICITYKIHPGQRVSAFFYLLELGVYLFLLGSSFILIVVLKLFLFFSGYSLFWWDGIYRERGALVGRLVG